MKAIEKIKNMDLRTLAKFLVIKYKVYGVEMFVSINGAATPMKDLAIEMNEKFLESEV